MGKYKLIAMDMDGTLLNDEKEISPKTLKTLERLQKDGTLLTICTGRNISGIEKYMELLKPKGPVICCNGAIIMSAGGKETLMNCTMNKDDARSIYDLGLQLGATLLIWCGNAFYTNELNERSYGYRKYSGLDPVFLEDFEALNEKGITKILFCHNPEQVNEYLKIVEEKEQEIREAEDTDCNNDLFTDTTYCKSLPIFLEFFSKRVSKGKALEFISKHLGIALNETVAFGDGMNDYPLIEKSGLGIAMGNSCRELKETANFVTLDNENDGIAFAIDFLGIGK